VNSFTSKIFLIFISVTVSDHHSRDVIFKSYTNTIHVLIHIRLHYPFNKTHLNYPDKFPFKYVAICILFNNRRRKE